MRYYARIALAILALVTIIGVPLSFALGPAGDTANAVQHKQISPPRDAPIVRIIVIKVSPTYSPTQPPIKNQEPRLKGANSEKPGTSYRGRKIQLRDFPLRA